MDANGKDKLGMSPRERADFKLEHGEDPEQMIERGAGHVAEQMLDVAKRAGFASVDDVLAKFDGDYSDDENAKINKALNSGGSDAVQMFGDLVGRLQRVESKGKSAAVEKRGGFTTNDEFQEATKTASEARGRNEPDLVLEDRIAATNSVIEGRGI